MLSFDKRITYSLAISVVIIVKEKVILSNVCPPCVCPQFLSQVPKEVFSQLLGDPLLGDVLVLSFQNILGADHCGCRDVQLCRNHVIGHDVSLVSGDPYEHLQHLSEGHAFTGIIVADHRLHPEAGERDFCGFWNDLQGLGSALAFVCDKAGGSQGLRCCLKVLPVAVLWGYTLP